VEGGVVKVGVFADTHIGRSIPNAVAEYRRMAFRHAFRQAINIFIGEGVEAVMHAGDLFERRSMNPSDSLFVKEELQRLVDSLGGSVKIIVVRGNHDGTAENSVLNYVEHPLAKYLVVLGEKTLIGDPEVYLNGNVAVIGFGYTPYVSAKLSEVKEAVRRRFENLKAESKILLAHMFVEGQDIPPGVPEYQVARLSLIKETGANIVVAGHYHKYLPLSEKYGILLLTPGATESVDLSDDSQHGVCILNLDRHVECKFIPIKPLHIIKNAIIDGGEAVRRPEWFIKEAAAAANQFSEQLKAEGGEGMLRIVLRGLLDGNRFDLEAEVERRVRVIQAENPRLLHVEVDNGLSEASPVRVSVPEHMTREEFLEEVFRVLGEERMVQALSLAEEVRIALEERASPQTGLLRESDRKPFIERWLKILGE
jgi:DNA repair exonuclease SbcCD nuclease subunit